ncbi:41641_t:CDS:2 [Gigaspora margarita]|uniref:41641_t:CDS:1 n=1 Tax=Gigaspora margarita TaxID=4874 RepID=A0ABN7WN04_GIGMA|nr:41641_t:CDS:2 [Gigaspora margarita]
MTQFKILLVGETGAGKSTLINVLTNYFRNGSPDNIKVAVRSKYHDVTEKDIEHVVSEFDVNDQTSSQTSRCFQYVFKYSKYPEYEYKFIDTPGLSDTNGQDRRNLELIVEKAVEEKYLNSIVFVINGKQARYSDAIKNTINGLNNYLPKALNNNLLLILTKTQKLGCNFQVDLFVKEVAAPKDVFYIDNIIFSNHPNVWQKDTELREEIDFNWKKSQKVIINFLNAIKKSEPTSTEDFQKISDLQRDLNDRINIAISEIGKINCAIITLTEAKNKSAIDDEYLKNTTNFVETKKIEYLEYVETEYENIICVKHPLNICHENCDAWFVASCHLMKVNLKLMDGSKLPLKQYCTSCGCGKSWHYKSKCKASKGCKTIQELIESKHEEFTSKAVNSRVNAKIKLSDLEVLTSSVEECYDKIQQSIEDLKTISRFSFDKILQSAFNKLKITAESITDSERKNMQLEKIFKIEKSIK